MNNHTIKELNQSDIDREAAVWRKQAGELGIGSDSVKRLREMESSRYRIVLGAYNNATGSLDGAIDYYRLKPGSDTHDGHIAELAVAPNLRSQHTGLGRRLVYEAVKRMTTYKPLTEITLHSVSGAKPFWLRIGFQAIKFNGKTSQLMTLSAAKAKKLYERVFEENPQLAQIRENRPMQKTTQKRAIARTQQTTGTRSKKHKKTGLQVASLSRQVNG